MRRTTSQRRSTPAWPRGSNRQRNRPVVLTEIRRFAAAMAEEREYSDESKQSTLGKRRLYPHCGKYEGERRGTRQGTRNHKRAQSFGSRMRRWNDGITRGETRSGRVGR